MDQTMFESLLDARVPQGLGGCWYGVYPALVIDIKDPDGQNRVKITLPWVADTNGARYEAWARMAVLMAGNNRGTVFMPDVNDEVLVAFEGGNPRHPFVIGGLWNGKDKPFQAISSDGKNDVKAIRSRNGVKVTLNDENGKEYLKLETPGGQTLTLKDGPGTIELADSNGNTIKLESSGITIRTGKKLTLDASQIEMTAGMVSVSSGISKFSGMVKADTVISNSVISASYTPGAGNIL